MYAIRSYYELAYLEVVQADAEYRYYTLARDLAAELLAGNERKFEAGLIPVTEVNEARSAMARITSYNVCYTKLLRYHRTGLYPLASLPAIPGIRITSYNVCYTKLLRSHRQSRYGAHLS